MNGRLSLAQVNDLSDAFAGYLRQTLGLTAGDRIAVQMPNCLAHPAVAFGVQKVWSRVLPLVTVPHARLTQALAKGRATLAPTPAKT